MATKLLLLLGLLVGIGMILVGALIYAPHERIYSGTEVGDENIFILSRAVNDPIVRLIEWESYTYGGQRVAEFVVAVPMGQPPFPFGVGADSAPSNMLLPIVLGGVMAFFSFVGLASTPAERDGDV